MLFQYFLQISWQNAGGLMSERLRAKLVTRVSELTDLETHFFILFLSIFNFFTTDKANIFQMTKVLCRATDCLLPIHRPGGIPLTITVSINATYHTDHELLCHASLNVSWQMHFHTPRTSKLEGSGNTASQSWSLRACLPVHYSGAIGQRSSVISISTASLCLWVCVSANISPEPHHQIFWACHSRPWLGSAMVQCDTLCTSGFVHDVTFVHIGLYIATCRCHCNDATAALSMG